MGVKVGRRRVRATMRSGVSVSVPLWDLESGVPGPCLLLTAAQHGNEVQGSEAIRRFVDLAGRDLARGRVLAVPFANLPAVRERRPHIRMGPEQPYGDDRGHNMNMTWGGGRGNDTGRLSAALARALFSGVTHVLDVHCWECHAAPALLIRDRPDLRLLARRLGPRFVQIRAPHGSTLGGRFCEIGRVGLSYECSGQYVVDEGEVRRCLRIIVNLARAIGILPGRPIPECREVLFSDATETVTVAAPITGLFVGRGLRNCDPVKKGAVLGHVLSDRDLSCHEITATVAGYLGAYGASRKDCDVALPGRHPYVSKGERLAAIVRPRPR
jgi:predicted deacylase